LGEGQDELDYPTVKQDEIRTEHQKFGPLGGRGV